MKLGALLFYRRIFCVRVKRTLFDIFVSIFIGISVLWTIAMLIMNGLQCGSNISALWTTDINIYLEYCVYVFPFETGFAISNFLLDLLIILLPVPKVCPLRSPYLQHYLLMSYPGVVHHDNLWSKSRHNCGVRLGSSVSRTAFQRRLQVLRAKSISGLAGSLARMVSYIQITVGKL